MPMHRIVSCLAVCLAIAAPARAQQKEGISPFVVDIRGATARHKAEPSVANDLGVTAGNLPTRSLGMAAGAHVYVLRGRKVTLGFGGNVVFARGSSAPDIIVNNVATGAKGPTVRRHFTTFSPEVSLNFGHRNGWSYISGGMFGRSKLYMDLAAAPA